MFRVTVLGVCIAAASCGPSNSQSEEQLSYALTDAMDVYLDMLVARFDANSCVDATPISMGGRKVAEGREVIRTYVADRECLEELEKQLLDFKFERSEENVFSFQSDRGWAESVRIEYPDGEKAGGVEWRDFNP